MLFVSCSPNLLIFGIRAPQPEYHPASGDLIGEKPGIDAQFTHGGVPTWAAEIALQYGPFVQKWGGLPDGTDPRLYLGRYDTAKEQAERGWSDEDRLFVEGVLQRHPSFGQRFIVVETAEEKQEPPWPTYDKTHWKKIVQVAKDIEADLDYVLDYEKNHGNRPAVVAQLEEALGGPVELVEA